MRKGASPEVAFARFGYGKGVIVAPLLALVSFQKTDALDALVARDTQGMHVPGMAICVLTGGRVVAERCYGVADLGKGTAVTPQSVFNLASVGKAMIATAVMLQVDAGKVRLDDPVSKFFENTPAFWSEVTVRQLLSHTGGLAREMAGYSMYRPYTRSELLSMAKATPPIAEPGRKYAYSNVGYFLLGEIVARTSGTTYAEFVTSRIFKPLGMANAATTQDAVPNRALGYAWRDNAYASTRPLGNLRTSGAFIVSIRDMERWAGEMLHPRVIPAADLQRMWTPTPLRDGGTSDYGFAWTIGSGGVVGHNGAQEGYRSEIRVDPRNDAAVVILTNSNDFSGARLAREAAALWVTDR